MQFHIHHDGQQLGPYPVEEVRARLASGAIRMDDMAWHPGLADWRPLSAMPEVVGDVPPPLPGSVPPAGAVPNSSGLAIASLVLGILALFTAGLTGIPAVICGHIALASIKKSAGARTGGGFAVTGLVLGYLGFLVMGVAVLAGIALPVIMQQQKKGARMEAMSNARSLGSALFCFEQDYNSFPCDATAAEVLKNHPETKLTLGHGSSNDYFRQLLAAGIVDSGWLFHIKTADCRQRPKRAGGASNLSQGECGFSYIIGPNSNSAPAQPLVACPLIPGSDRFDPQPFGRKAVILWSDMNVTTPTIDRDGHVLLDGRNVLDPAHPVWQGKPPRIVWPE